MKRQLGTRMATITSGPNKGRQGRIVAVGSETIAIEIDGQTIVERLTRVTADTDDVSTVPRQHG